MDAVVADTPHVQEPVVGGPSVVHAAALPSPVAGVSADQVDDGDQAQVEVLQIHPPGPPLTGQQVAGAVHKVGSENNEIVKTLPLM